MSYVTVKYDSGILKEEKHRYSLDITEAVQGWKLGNYEQDKGIIIKSATAAVENS